MIVESVAGVTLNHTVPPLPQISGSSAAEVASVVSVVWNGSPVITTAPSKSSFTGSWAKAIPGETSPAVASAKISNPWHQRARRRTAVNIVTFPLQGRGRSP